MRYFRLNVGLLFLCAAHTALAVQGNLLSSSGFVASTVGGATVAQFTNEFDAAIDNPALMEYTKTQPGTHKFSLGLEYAYSPSSFAIDFGATHNPYVNSKLKAIWVPFLGYFYNISERFKFGTGIFVVGGAGTDFSGTIYKVKGTYSAISVPLALSYKLSEKINLGASLDIVVTRLTSNNSGIKNATSNAATAAASLGATFEGPKSIVLGLDYVGGTTATFKKLYYPVSANQSKDMKIGTPAQYSIGIGQNTSDYSWGLKYRYITWKDTANYRELDWVNQSTYSLGGQYKLMDKFTGRAGIYYVTSVYGETKNVNGDQSFSYQGSPITNFLRDSGNAMQFGTAQWQYGLGAGYQIGQKSNLDFGLVYEPETTIHFKGTTKLTGPYDIRKKDSVLYAFVAYSQEV